MAERRFGDLQAEYNRYTEAFKTGTLLDMDQFGQFLGVGLDYYRAHASLGDVSHERFGRIALRYQQALGGGIQARIKFCHDEAQFQLELAADAQRNATRSENPDTWLRNFQQNRTFAASWLLQGAKLVSPPQTETPTS